MSIGAYLSKEDCNENLKNIINKFHYPKDIIGFNLQPFNLITDDTHKNCVVDWALYLNPKRKKQKEYLITGDCAFIKFQKEPERRKFMDKLKKNIQNQEFPCTESMTTIAIANLYGKGVIVK